MLTKHALQISHTDQGRLTIEEKCLAPKDKNASKKTRKVSIVIRIQYKGEKTPKNVCSWPIKIKILTKQSIYKTPKFLRKVDYKFLQRGRICKNTSLHAFNSWALTLMELGYWDLKNTVIND
jgi:hypothetical protein